MENKVNLKNIFQASKVRRGQIWFVYEAPEVSDVLIKNITTLAVKTRPSLILDSNDELLKNPMVVHGMPLTHSIREDDLLVDQTTRRGADLIVKTGDSYSRIRTSEIHALDMSKLSGYIAQVDNDLLSAVDMILLQKFGLCGDAEVPNQEKLQNDALAYIRGARSNDESYEEPAAPPQPSNT